MGAPITTILFTDLVDSTALMQRFGHERAQSLFATHHWLLSDAISAHGGSELQWLGDGLMVAFASTADVARCAIAMEQAATPWHEEDPGSRTLSLCESVAKPFRTHEEAAGHLLHI